MTETPEEPGWLCAPATNYSIHPSGYFLIEVSHLQAANNNLPKPGAAAGAASKAAPQAAGGFALPAASNSGFGLAGGSAQDSECHLILSNSQIFFLAWLFPCICRRA